MSETDFARHITGFLSHYLPGQRNLSTNTISSYRDAFKLFLVYCESETTLKIEKIRIVDITQELLAGYLTWIENDRGCGIATRNQRLAAFKSFFHYVVAMAPEHLRTCQHILAIPMKKCPRTTMSFFSPEGLHLLLSQPDITTPNGRRDHAVLVFLYDSAARVQELINLTVRDIRLEQPTTVTLHGKGRKTRIIPLSTKTASIMEQYLKERGYLGMTAALDLPVFTNSRKYKLTRAGVAHILARYVKTMSINNHHHVPESVSPHTLRHSKAVHLLRSGVPLIYIRDFLGHTSVTTTEIYVKVDAEETRKALEGAYEVPSQEAVPDWERDKSLLAWLSDLCD
ncbi:MAG: tyrosine-type recombinase/integrase [Spirochaetota bacterium]